MIVDSLSSFCNVFAFAILYSFNTKMLLWLILNLLKKYWSAFGFIWNKDTRQQHFKNTRANQRVLRSCFLTVRHDGGMEEAFKVFYPQHPELRSAHHPHYSVLTVHCFSFPKRGMVVQNFFKATWKSFPWLHRPLLTPRSLVQWPL